MATNITLLKIEDPYHFWGKEVPGPGMSAETSRFQELVREIQEYCSSDQYVVEYVSDPVKGKMYLAQRPDDNIWYRVRVKTSLQSSFGIKVNCHLVDFADTVSVQLNRLKEIPVKLKTFPSQAKSFRLHGIQPTTLNVSLEDENASIGPAKKWDIAAVEYFSNLVENRSARVDVHSIGRRETRFVTLYVNTPLGEVNVNEELVQRNFAVFAEREFDEVSEIGSSDGACSRPITPMTFTPRLPTVADQVTHSKAERDSHLRHHQGLEVNTSHAKLGPETSAGRSASWSSSSGDERRGLSSMLSPRDRAERGLGLQSPRERLERSPQSSVLSRLENVGLSHQEGIVGQAYGVHKTLSEGSEDCVAGDHRVRGSPIGTKPASPLITDRLNNVGQSGTFDVDRGEDINASIVTLGQMIHDNPSMGVRTDPDSTPPRLQTDELSRKVSSPETVGRGRGLLALCNTASEVGRKRSASPLSSPSPSPSPSCASPSPSQSSQSSSNILRSSNLQKSLEKRHSSGSSSHVSKSEDISPRVNANSPGQRLQEVTQGTTRGADDSATPPSVSVPRNPTRLPFIIDRGDIRLRESLSPSAKTLGPRNESPPSFMSPVSHINAPKMSWMQDASRGVSQKSPSSSDWNKMSSTSGGSDISDQEGTSSSLKKIPVMKAASSERARIIEDSLKKQLSHGTAPADTSGRHTKGSHDRSHDQQHGQDMGVVVHGDCPPEPIKEIVRAPFPEIIRKTYEQLTHKPVSLIQAYTWPTVLRGRDMVGIAPGEAGRSLAYILPLLTKILHTATYEKLPPGTGPLVLIVCPSWRQAATVFDDVQVFVKAASLSLKTILLYGGGNDKQQEVQLINGCQLVVSTLPCILRMMESNHTNLNRLCHLVFDEAQILFRDFIDEVKELMFHFLSVLRVQQKRSAPRQLVVMATEWSAAIGSFLRTYMTNQLVIITHKLEAAIYARVRQDVDVLDATQRSQVLIGKLQSGLAHGIKVIIFANDKPTAIELTKILTSSSYYTLCALEGASSDVIDKVKKEWYTHHRPDSIPLLVMMDGAIQDVGATDASFVIHYDFPQNKANYGKRLCCMMRHFESQLKEKKRSRCQSLAFVSRDKLHVLAHMSSLLFRSGQHFPQQFTKEQVEQAKEGRRKHKDLCYNLRAFGMCRDEKCSNRHVVYSGLDAPGNQPGFISLPTQGTIMFLITHVINASHYYVRILKHRHSDTHKVISISTDYVQLNLDLQEWFGDPTHRVSQRPLALGDVCGVRDDAGCYFRAKVVAWVSKATDDSPGTAQVQYVDEGGFDVLNVDKLYQLSDELRAVCFQAVEVFVCQMRPIDKDYSWTTQGDLYINDLFRAKELEGQIVLSLGNTLWLDPVVERRVLPETKELTTVHNIRKELIRKGLAADNPDHLKKLRQLCEGKVKLPPLAPITKDDKRVSVKLPAPESLNEECENYVYLSSMDTPHLIYVQPVKSNYRLEQLMEALNRDMASHVISDECQVTVGQVCIVNFPMDGRWYRARMMAENDASDERDMFFIDYGDQEWLPKANVCPLPKKFADLAPQAIQCAIDAILPTDSDGWTEKASNALWDMCIGDAENVKIPLTVEVTGCELCEFTGGYRYAVNMFDQSQGEKVLVSKRLIDADLAKPASGFMQVMFPYCESGLADNSPSQQLSRLCAQLYQVKSYQGQIKLLNRIDELLSEESCDEENLIGSGTVRGLCQVLCNGKLKDESKDQLIMILIQIAVESPGLSWEVAKEGGLKGILTLMDMVSESRIKEDISQIVRDVVSEKRPRDLFLAAGGMNVLGNQLVSVNSSSTIENLCASLQKLIYYNDLVRKELPSFVLLSLCDIMKTTTEVNKLCPVLRVLSDLANNRRCREFILNNFGLDAACSLMWNATNDLVIRYTAIMLESMSENQTARQIMLQEELPPRLEGCIVSERTTTDTKDACSSLLDILDQHEVYMAIDSKQKALPSAESIVPKTHPTGQSKDEDQNVSLNGRGDDDTMGEDEEFDDMPPLEEGEIELQTAHPKVLWSQRHNSVLLSVQLRGVTDQEVKVTSTTIDFSTIQGFTLYEFHIDLFSRVDCKNYVVVPAGGEVLITLYKESIGIKWTRLTQSKEKIPYISIDFERWKDDEDSDSERTNKRAPKRAPGRIAEGGSDENGSHSNHDSDDEDEYSLSDFSGDDLDKVFRDTHPLPSKIEEEGTENST